MIAGMRDENLMTMVVSIAFRISEVLLALTTRTTTVIVGRLFLFSSVEQLINNINTSSSGIDGTSNGSHGETRRSSRSSRSRRRSRSRSRSRSRRRRRRREKQSSIGGSDLFLNEIVS